ncbi:helix-turn-helix transcriptional regulator [Vibrio parahaemolyticus]|nr:helix-turn-helix domain-containing protein [Vibrio parahaemolyticus]EJB8530334.1 helix-turn-helix transcriptional regulator [Vibrio parahaemolyticus]EJE4159233.1 helix-turn-helix transcriptional regulator [Vibrio parahaemolyticus]HBC3821199.1 helix-turn-helix transcriptional regulator [Vibrio parahaemolyticus]
MSQITERKNITGGRIKEIRLAKGLSQADIERECSLKGIDITRSKLAKVESGMIRVTDEMLRDLALVLNVEAGVFFESSVIDG